MLSTPSRKKPSSASSLKKEPSIGSSISSSPSLKFPPIHKRSSTSQGINSSRARPGSVDSTISLSESVSSVKSSSSNGSQDQTIGTFLTSLPSSKLRKRAVSSGGTTKKLSGVESIPSSLNSSLNSSLTSLEQIPLSNNVGVSRSEVSTPVTKLIEDDNLSMCSDSCIEDMKDRMEDSDFFDLRESLQNLKNIIPNFNIDLEQTQIGDELELDDILNTNDELMDVVCMNETISTDASITSFISSSDKNESMEQEATNTEEINDMISEITALSARSKESNMVSEATEGDISRSEFVNIGTVYDMLTNRYSSRPSSVAGSVGDSSDVDITEIKKDEIRKELEEFVQEVTSRKIVIDTEDGQVDVILPPDLDILTKSVNTEIFEMRDDVIFHLAQASAITTEEAYEEIKEGDISSDYMKKIHKLDLLLQQKEVKGKPLNESIRIIVERHKSEKEILKKTSLMKFVRESNKNPTEALDSSRRKISSNHSLIRGDSAKSGFTRKKLTPRAEENTFLKKNQEMKDDAVYFTLTDEEEKRLIEIIKEDDPPEGIPYGMGFEPSKDEIQKLESIDEKLKSIVPVERRYLFESHESYEQGGWTSLNKTVQVTKQEEKAEKGDYVREARLEREHKNKLNDIEDRLNHLRELPVIPLGRDKLDDLLRKARIENEMFEKRSVNSQ